jgi:hypothetical protein
MAVRVALCVILLAAGASAQWKRYLQLAGGGTDTPPSHDLAYFHVDPCSRSDKQDRIVQCPTYPSEDELKLRLQTRTNLRAVGMIGAFMVYDLEYFFANAPAGREGPDVNSVLVETPEHRFHEIQVTQRIGGTIHPTEIVYAGSQPIIAPKYHQRDDIEVYFVIADAGSAMLDLAPLTEAARKVVPDGVDIWPYGRCDFKSLTFNLGGWEGRAEVSFTVEKARMIPGEARWVPQ